MAKRRRETIRKRRESLVGISLSYKRSKEVEIVCAGHQRETVFLYLEKERERERERRYELLLVDVQLHEALHTAIVLYLSLIHI